MHWDPRTGSAASRGASWPGAGSLSLAQAPQEVHQQVLREAEVHLQQQKALERAAGEAGSQATGRNGAGPPARPPSSHLSPREAVWGCVPGTGRSTHITGDDLGADDVEEVQTFAVYERCECHLEPWGGARSPGQPFLRGRASPRLVGVGDVGTNVL